MTGCARPMPQSTSGRGRFKALVARRSSLPALSSSPEISKGQHAVRRSRPGARQSEARQPSADPRRCTHQRHRLALDLHRQRAGRRQAPGPFRRRTSNPSGADQGWSGENRRNCPGPHPRRARTGRRRTHFQPNFVSSGLQGRRLGSESMPGTPTVPPMQTVAECIQVQAEDEDAERRSRTRLKPPARPTWDVPSVIGEVGSRPCRHLGGGCERA